jgi:hypothetical protein
VYGIASEVKSMLRFTLVGLLLAGSVASGTRISDEASPPVCSFTAFRGLRLAENTHLLGSAAADTLLAGPGNVRPSGERGHWGSGAPRAIYGQRVHVERFGGADSLRIAEAFQRQGHSQAVLVPWDYDEGCSTTIWSPSARWILPAEPGVFTVRLRPEVEWAQGLPTFDAFTADLQPYPHGLLFRKGYEGAELQTEPSLTAAEYYELYRRLPTQEMIQEQRVQAAAAVRAWAHANPAVAAKFPTARILRHLEYLLR